MSLPVRYRITFSLFFIGIAAIAYFWVQLGLWQFPALPAVRLIVLSAGLLNGVVILIASSVVLKMAIALNSVLFSLLLTEFVLEALEKRSAKNVQPTATIDLKFRKQSFVRRPLPHTLDIVAIGDSQTRGVTVPATKAWPARLEKLSNRKVYNLSLGGLAPPDYLLLFQRAANSNPNIAIVALYFGNDVWGSYHVTYTEKHHRRFRTKAGNKIIDDTEHQTKALWTQLVDFQKTYRPSFVNRVASLSELAFFRLISGTTAPQKTGSLYDVQKDWAMRHPELGNYYENDRVRTVFNPAYRLPGIDLQRPASREGLRIIRSVLRRLRTRAGEMDVRLLILLIPTKETVYAPLLKSQKRFDGAYARLVNAESEARRAVVRFLAEEQISYVDALAALQQKAAVAQIYPAQVDGHPTTLGYQLIALSVYDDLKRRKWLQ